MYYRRLGSVPPTRHTQHRAPDGALYYEELFGAEGFSSESALLYHRHLPSTVVESRPWIVDSAMTSPNIPLLPHHLRLHTLLASEDAASVDAVTGRHLLLANRDVRLGYVGAGSPSPLYRDAIGDECVFVEAGSGVMESVFGPLRAGPGDYVLIPRGTTHRWVPDPGVRLDMFCVESAGHVHPPGRYQSPRGQFLESAPYCERDIQGPDTLCVSEEGETEIYIKHAGDGPFGTAGTVHVSRFHPFDVVGWDGCLYPYSFNVTDFQPLTGRVHLPPPVHQTFEGPNFVICNFVPRKVDYHPLSVPVPYYHSNTDSDEVIFYVAGDYSARKGSGIEAGSLSLHPAGHTHGPQPGAYEASLGTVQVDELAIMVDTFRPLELGAGGRAADDPSYPSSWTGK